MFEERELRPQTSDLRSQTSDLYYSRIEILGIFLFLQSVLANLHANTYTTIVRTLTTIIAMIKMTMRERESEKRDGERERTQNFITQG